MKKNNLQDLFWHQGFFFDDQMCLIYTRVEHINTQRNIEQFESVDGLSWEFNNLKHWGLTGPYIVTLSFFFFFFFFLVLRRLRSSLGSMNVAQGEKLLRSQDPKLLPSSDSPETLISKRHIWGHFKIFFSLQILFSCHRHYSVLSWVRHQDSW